MRDYRDSTHYRDSLGLFISDGHRFMQENDPKHRSGVAKNIFDENGINWWKMLAESSDLNPIENLSYELKEFIQGQVKPSNK